MDNGEVRPERAYQPTVASTSQRHPKRGKATVLTSTSRTMGLCSASKIKRVNGLWQDRTSKKAAAPRDYCCCTAVGMTNCISATSNTFAQADVLRSNTTRSSTSPKDPSPSRPGIHPRGRLIQQQHGRPANQRDRQRKLSLVAAAQCPRWLVLRGAQANGGHRRRRRFVERALALAVVFKTVANIIARGA